MTDAPIAAGDQTLLRRLNASAVLTALRDRHPQTVRELATRIGLSRPTVEAAIAELLAGGWVDELAPEGGGMGRPARRYRFRAAARFVFGIDIGAHKVLGMLSDLEGRVVASRRVTVDPDDGARRRLTAARTVANRCLTAASVAPASVCAAGIGTPGVVDATGTVTITDVLPEWIGLPIAREIGRFLSCPVLVENDATLAALAERWRGAAPDVDDVVYILAGQRVGAGILIRGKPHRGYHGAAGEIAYAGFLGVNSVIPLDETVLAAAAGGEPRAVATVDDFTLQLATYVAALVLALDPELVVIGGGLSRSSDLLLPGLESALAGLCLVPPRLAASTMGDESVAIGALRLALDHAHRHLMAI